MYRTIADINKTFDGVQILDLNNDNSGKRIPVSDSYDLENHLRNSLDPLQDKKIALALSGGIDSAILAKFMPEGSVAYTFKCIVPEWKLQMKQSKQKNMQKYVDWNIK